MLNGSERNTATHIKVSLKDNSAILVTAVLLLAGRCNLYKARLASSIGVIKELQPVMEIRVETAETQLLSNYRQVD